MPHTAYAAVDTALVLVGNVAVYQTPDGTLIPVPSLVSHTSTQYLRAVTEANGTITVSIGHRSVQ